MSNCVNCNDTSSLSYSRCNPPVSTNCVFYQGESATCEYDSNFKLCKGNSLSDVQLDFFNNICNIKSSLDVTDIQFLCSEDWDDRKDNEKTIHNLFLDITGLQCTYVGYVDYLNKLVEAQTTTIYGKDAIDPYVSICLKCCGTETECNDNSNLHLSEALDKITACICNLSGKVTNTQTTSTTTLNEVKKLEKRIVDLEYENCLLKARVQAIETTLKNISPAITITPPNYSTCAPLINPISGSITVAIPVNLD